MMHFSLNHLLVSRELFAHNSYNLPKLPDFNQLEFDITMNALHSSEKKDALKIEYEQISSEIASFIDVPFDTMYMGGDMIYTREV